MDCNCEKAPEFPTKAFIPGPIEIPINFRAVTIPADQGDDVANPPQNGAYRNVVLKYAANGHTYIYSSDGIPVMLVGSITFNSLPDRPKYDGQPMTSYTDIPDLTDEVSTLQSEVQALATDFSYKGSVEDYAHLPNDAATGDVYTTLDTGVIYVWDGDEWVALNEYPPVFTGTDGTSAGTVGLVPAPETTDAGKVLGASGNWEQNGPTIVQTTGTSQADVMSQDAVSKQLYGKYNGNYDGTRIQIGSGSVANTAWGVAIGSDSHVNVGYTVAIGHNARSERQGSAALGAFSQPSSIGEVNIGLPRATSAQVTSLGHNSTPYRLLTGLANPENGHDAVTKEYTDARIIQNAGAPTTSTVGAKGQILEDTTNGKLYICTAVTGDGGTPEVFTYTWTEIAVSGSVPTVVQTIGTSTTNVMSQNAVSSLIYSDPASPYDVRIGSNATAGGVNAVAIGPSAVANGDGSVAIGAASNTSAWKNSVALGRFAQCNDNGQVNIGMGTHTTEGYSGSAYRLLSGLYDPQTDHDAATKGYADTKATITMTSTDPGEGGTLAANNFIAVYSAS